MKRRTFLQTSTLLGASLGATAKAASSEPLIIATWKNEKATIAGWNKLMETGKALDGVEAGARIPEADPNDTSVGYGGYPDRDGHVTLDACIMDHVGNAGSVTFLEGIMHPISVARAVMEKTPHVMLSGAGALKFALDQGFKVENLLTESSKKAWEEWKKESKYEPVINIERHDTIGLLGIGKAGEIAGACTTSGLAFKMHGRVGDSPIIGGAVFCDDEVGGACATGLGEFVMKTLGSFLIVELMRQGMSPQKACEEAVMRIVKRYKYKEFQIGYLALNKKGEYGAYAIQKGFNYTITKNGKTQVIESASYM
ncbi:N(4)-(beta-N-acetylglucosaminyl)-L-asparaginase [Aquirufa antheringensis]|jgi:N4-(beta-N-acetylglucosaminyl)-L-asparaginase|uniref:Glycosylasparaginase n=1 Tax=Aquirufa antheringensis TaxID=2516559 RepID=A0A4Q9BA65_9BACT|nr:N(4)-(beta-N-acetylglucosaminyl)-L-asparaginase [Aquirufa antheringensis]MCZ2488224.1 N(4)-(beta-N-acetylglucosaminyl)-L-asparaginase [Aquirufa antheringensis]MCZ2490234.1 N(4)-(beta-N-acetylglucosaminyl)-L-asparaginase [Aquirufa antheringensis]TBH70269.1 glycosylasparaginase [Aquirufa antheringensis]TBH72134.1 glycosylasparaginase [Aquirufa antheringensis]